MVDYTRLAATAKRLIEANGRTVTIEKDDRTPANTAKPWLGPDDTADASVTPIVAFVPASGSGFGFQRIVEGNLQDTVTEVGLVAHTSLGGFDIEKATRVVDGTKVLRVNFVDKLKPSTTELIYAMGLTE